VALFLLLNLGVALVVAMPVRSLLSAELDDNLYGDAMARGASWRWFDTVEREHPEAVGNAAPWTALFSDRGIGLSDLADVSGPPAALLVAGLLLLLLHGPLHVGYLATRRRPDPAAPEDDLAGPGHGPRAVLSAAVAFWLPGVLLALLAAAAYAAVYAAVYVAPAGPLGRFAEYLQGERWNLAQVWLRLGLTLLLVLVVKAFFDLAKLGLVERGSGWRLPAALALAGGELWRRGWAYVGIDLALGLATLALGAAWWIVSGPLVAQTWLGLAILFVLHQAVLAVRIVLRLAHLDGAQAIFAIAHAAPPAAPAPAGARPVPSPAPPLVAEHPPEGPPQGADPPAEVAAEAPGDDEEPAEPDGGGSTPPPAPPPR